MASRTTIQEHVTKIEENSTQEDQLFSILQTYLELFPVKNAFLLRYSPLGYLGEGILALHDTDLVNIRDMRDDIRSLPVIYKAIRERRAKYCHGFEFFKQTSSKYIVSSRIDSMVVTPICVNSIVIGYICSNEFKQDLQMNEKLLESFTHFGRVVGKMIESSHVIEESKLLSNRELEVMQRIAQGQSTKEMATFMNLRDVTVIQYAKTAMKKLGAQNRAQAVAELFRKGIIS